MKLGEELWDIVLAFIDPCFRTAFADPCQHAMFLVRLCAVSKLHRARSEIAAQRALERRLAEAEAQRVPLLTQEDLAIRGPALQAAHAVSWKFALFCQAPEMPLKFCIPSGPTALLPQATALTGALCMATKIVQGSVFIQHSHSLLCSDPRSLAAAQSWGMLKHPGFLKRHSAGGVQAAPCLNCQRWRLLHDHDQHSQVEWEDPWLQHRFQMPAAPTLAQVAAWAATPDAAHCVEQLQHASICVLDLEMQPINTLMLRLQQQAGLTPRPAARLIAAAWVGRPLSGAAADNICSVRGAARTLARSRIKCLCGENGFILGHHQQRDAAAQAIPDEEAEAFEWPDVSVMIAESQ